MSCPCCRPGGDSCDEEEEEEEEEVGSFDMSMMKDRVQHLVDSGVKEIPPAYVRPFEERPVDVRTEQIPVVDLSGIDGKDRQSVRNQVGKACEDWGFFQVVNHGVPGKVLDSMRNDGRAFFALPMEYKLRYACKPGVIASEGYGSKMLSKDDQLLDWRDYYDLHTLPLSRRRSSGWPDDPQSFRETVLQYSHQMKLLAERILELISESLGLPSSHLREALGDPSQNVSVNYYPPCPQPELTLGLQAHSDLGAITILMQADIAGLQVKKNGMWIAVEPVENALVVNLGDMMEVMSNGRYRSVEHRAVVNGDRDRLSVATFLDPAKDCLLTPAKELIDEEHPRLYKEVLFRDFISAWYSKGPDGKRNIDSLKVIPSIESHQTS
ncbi:hypothetical protein R1sor_019962 [Riccia sorocarpa]|uniref:Fe2OG dioxygenase domain-containing protein n=1 Tax=Riccia sorocarpa TaxID=122646 RepID=A0ABD3IDZ2_9MARC